MGQAGKYLRRMQSGYAHWCPACDEMHVFAVDMPFSNGAKWTFNGDLDKPTFTPSMNIAWGKQADPNWKDEEPGDSGRCHYFITAGQIAFCGDCTHALSDKTVALPELPSVLRDAPANEEGK